VLHQAAYRELGLRDWSYDAIECDAGSLPGLLDSLGPQWAGLSLTMPLKRAVLPLLDESERLVTEVGCANTVVLSGGARLGYNTDVPGIFTALSEAGAPTGGSVLVLGAGATACSALAALRLTGADNITVAVRDQTRAGQLSDVVGRLGLTVRLVRLEQLELQEPVGLGGFGRSWQLLISTVPAGAADGLAAHVAAGALVADVVFDVVYDPWPTRLAEAASKAGSTVIAGFELLLHQAAGQVELMTGLPAPVAVMRSAGLAELRRRRDTV